MLCAYAHVLVQTMNTYKERLFELRYMQHNACVLITHQGSVSFDPQTPLIPRRHKLVSLYAYFCEVMARGKEQVGPSPTSVAAVIGCYPGGAQARSLAATSNRCGYGRAFVHLESYMDVTGLALRGAQVAALSIVLPHRGLLPLAIFAYGTDSAVQIPLRYREVPVAKSSVMNTKINGFD